MDELAGASLPSQGAEPKSKRGRPVGQKDVCKRFRRGKLQLLTDAIVGVKNRGTCVMQSHVQAPCPHCKSCLSVTFVDAAAPDAVESNVLSLDAINALSTPTSS
jgi:hypothetical protein